MEDTAYYGVAEIVAVIVEGDGDGAARDVVAVGRRWNGAACMSVQYSMAISILCSNLLYKCGETQSARCCRIEARRAE